jgi:hypothetical protein
MVYGSLKNILKCFRIGSIEKKMMYFVFYTRQANKTVFASLNIY